jgi:hypothetical protein
MGWDTYSGWTDVLGEQRMNIKEPLIYGAVIQPVDSQRKAQNLEPG